jgi:hypothetical protein
MVAARYGKCKPEGGYRHILDLLSRLTDIRNAHESIAFVGLLLAALMSRFPG